MMINPAAPFGAAAPPGTAGLAINPAAPFGAAAPPGTAGLAINPAAPFGAAAPPGTAGLAINPAAATSLGTHACEISAGVASSTAEQAAACSSARSGVA